MTIPTLQKILEHLPFVLAVGQPNPRFNLQRLIEAAVIGAVTGIIVTYIAVSKIETAIEYMQRDLVKLETRVDKFHPVNPHRDPRFN